MKYKSFSKIIIAFAMILASGMIFFSIYMMTDHQLQMAEATTAVYELKNMQLEYNLPLRVIENVSNVYNRDKALSDTMNDAYLRNQTEAQVLSGEMMLLIDQLYVFSNQSPLTRINSFSESLSTLRNDLLQIKNLNKQVQDYLELDLSSKDEIQILTLIEETMEKYIDSSQSTLVKIEDRTIRETYWLNSIVIVLLVLLMFSLVGLNLRFQYFYKHFIEKGYKMSDMNHYDFKQLEFIQPIFYEEKEAYQQVSNNFQEQEITLTIKNFVKESYDMDKVMKKLFIFVKELMGIERIGIAFVDYEVGKIITEGAYSEQEDHVIGVGYTVNIEDTSLKDIIAHGEGLINNDLDDYQAKNIDSIHVKDILLENIHSNMALPLISNNQVFALMFFSSSKKNHFNDYHMRMGKRILYEISEIVKRSYLIAVVFKSYLSSMADLVDNRDNETGDHLTRMTKYSVAIAKGIKESHTKGYEVDSDFIIEVNNNALSHDIGKVGIADAILKKPGKLTPEEFEIMKTHVNIGVDLIRKIRKPLQGFDSSYFKYAEDIICGHHEKWDGSGYPSGLKGDEIPLAGRIVAVADVFDAITSRRVYKDAFGFEESVGIILEGKGKHFDPFIVDIFMKNIKSIREIYDESLQTQLDG